LALQDLQLPVVLRCDELHHVDEPTKSLAVVREVPAPGHGVHVRELDLKPLADGCTLGNVEVFIVGIDVREGTSTTPAASAESSSS